MHNLDNFLILILSNVAYEAQEKHKYESIIASFIVFRTSSFAKLKLK